MRKPNWNTCCVPMRQAYESGTDNEGYGALAHDFDDGVGIGYSLPSITFCPWCGLRISKDVATEASS